MVNQPYSTTSEVNFGAAETVKKRIAAKAIQNMNPLERKQNYESIIKGGGVGPGYGSMGTSKLIP